MQLYQRGLFARNSALLLRQMVRLNLAFELIEMIDIGGLENTEQPVRQSSRNQDTAIKLSILVGKLSEQKDFYIHLGDEVMKVFRMD